MIFCEKDKTNRLIHLSKERWRHIRHEHPELTDFISEIEKTLKYPDKINQNQNDINSRFYYKYIKDKKRYLLLIVKYLNGKGFLITAYLTRSIK